MGKLRLLAITAAISAVLVSTASAEESASPYDVTTYSVVWTVPAAKNVRVVRGTGYAGEGAAALTLDVTYPAGGSSSTRWPAVVFVNGVGGKLNEWEIYKSWARHPSDAEAQRLLGLALTRQGKPAEAVEALCKAVEPGDAQVEKDEDLSSLRSDPRYAALLAKLR